MLTRLLPLLAGLLPIVAIHGSYLLAIAAERVPACIPYLDGCTSISSTGRYPPASYLFKSVMLPQAILLVLYWLASVAWLRAMERAAGEPRRSGTAAAAFGSAGAVALILYVTFLGTQEPFYEFMRRFGVYLYFLFSVLAQLALGFRSHALARDRSDRLMIAVTRTQIVLAVTPFALGLLNLVLKATLADPDRAENVIEWIFALLMQAYIALSYLTWRRSGFAPRFDVRPG